jgi:Mn2+/Fe2+ NRAMP family transporter
MGVDRFGDLKAQALPPVPRLWAALGPGVVWMALAQGSGELYFWPYFAAKYGALYLCLLVPACLLQMPINVEIGRYTVLTGESVFVGFTRLHRAFGLFMWVYFAVNFVFIGSFASAGGTALADIVPWPAGLDARGRTLFWTYAITAAFAAALFVGRTVYRTIERFMFVVAIVTAVGLVAASLQPQVLEVLPRFLRAVVLPTQVPPLPRDPAELEKFYTMMCYSGLGGFWSLFYSFWIREKGFGMAAYAGHITSPLTGKKELVTLQGWRFEDTAENRSRYRGWMRTLLADNSIGVVGNLLTTFLLVLLSFAILHPQGKFPDKWRIVAEQGDFFGVLWGPAARVAFLVIAGLFLMDSWLAGVDAVSRVHSEMLCTYSTSARRKGLRFWYYAFLVAMAAVTWIVLPIGEPGKVLTFTGIISVFAVAIFSVALWQLNYRFLPRVFPGWVRGGRLQHALFVLVVAFYVIASAYYIGFRIRGSA